MLMWSLLTKENRPLEAPDAYVKPFNEREQAAGAPDAYVKPFNEREQATGGAWCLGEAF